MEILILKGCACLAILAFVVMLYLVTEGQRKFNERMRRDLGEYKDYE